jgi:hypothetical protein
MASQLYPKGKAHILGLATKVDLIADNIKVAMIDTADETYNAADEFLSDVTGAGIVGTSGNLTGKAVTGGVFTASNPTIPSVSGDTTEALIIYKDTGSAATSPLIAWMDTATYTPDGTSVIVNWNGSGIFAI